MTQKSGAKGKLGAALWAYLALSFVMLLLHKFDFLPFLRETFLLFVNFNLLFLAGLAVAGATASAVARGRGTGEDSRLWQVLSLGMIVLLVWEVILFVEEIFLTVDENALGIVKAFGIVGRLILILVFWAAITTGPSMPPPNPLQKVAPRIGLAGLLVFAFLFIVVY